MEKFMTNSSPERQKDPLIFEENFELAFKLVFFDEDNKEVEPAQYRGLSTFNIEKDVSRPQ